ncbi:MAG: ATP-NAD kinase family protein, partial [Candidatus Promineifilaceae bacterium]
MIKGKIGLIVNPIAGIGGAVGLKGSDGREIQERAAALGAKITAQERTKRALEKISLDGSSPTIVTYPGEMGESVSRECGFDPMVIGTITPGFTSAADTKMAAAQMSAMGVRLILFTGGDGTARDVASVVGTDVPVV